MSMETVVAELPAFDENDRIIVMRERFDLAKVKAEKFPGALELWKPAGLWWAVGSAWIDWCRGESFAVNAMNHAYQLKLDTSRSKRPILSIVSRAQVIELERKYSTSRHSLHGIDWDKVAKDYGAIEVHEPRGLYYDYWTRPLESMWLSTWDVSSGCLWDPTLILRVEEVAIPPAKEDENR